MTSTVQSKPLWRGRVVAILAWLSQLVAGLMYCSVATAQDQAGPNIIISSDAPSIQQQGGFRQFSTRLSHSSAPLRSVGRGVHNLVFSTDIPQPGYYRIFVWWPQVYFHVGTVGITVKYLGGSSTVDVDQGQRTGQWVPIGIFQFNDSAQVTLKGDSDATVLADAVRLQYMGPRMPPLDFETDELPVAAVGEQYAAWFDLIGGTAPLTFVADRRQLPPGLELDRDSGTIIGTPTAAGSYQFDVHASDQSGQSAVRTYTIDVLRGQSASGKAGATADNTASRETRFRARTAVITAKDGVPAGAPPDLSNLVGLIASLPEGEWLRANLNAFQDVWTPADLRSLNGLNNPTPFKLIAVWSSFAWDPNRGDLWLFGGGHANYSGNDIYRWRATTRMWERASLPSEIKQDDLGNWQAVDGWSAAPASAHTYDNNMFFPHIDRFVVYGGAAYNSGGAFKRELTPTTNRLTGPFFFDPNRADANKVGGTTGSHVMRVAPHPEIIGGNMWTNRDIYVNIPGNPPLFSGQVNGCTAYSDENGKDVAYIGATVGGAAQLNLFKYMVNNLAQPSLDTLEKVGLFWNGTGGLTSCGIDPVRKVFVRTGSQTIPFTYWDLTTAGPANKDLRITPVDPTGEFASLLSSNQLMIQQCALDFDPARSKFALWCGDGRIWMLTPPATISPNGWTIVKQPAPALSTPSGDTGTGLLGKWKYVPNLDAFIGLQDPYQGNIWIYKPVGWTNPIGGSQSPPTGVSASDGTSTSSVSVGWNASPGATSYKIYRSQTSGVQGFQIGTATTTSFLDTTPFPGTTYYYGVTATGAAGTSALSSQDSGFAAAGGGTLAGVASLSLTIDLTAVGTTDWIHWLPVNRKAGGGAISDYVPVGAATATPYSDPRSFVWTDGTPNSSGNDSAGATVLGLGCGFSFSVAAGTSPQTLIVYVGGSNSTGKLTAHLSDASADDYVDTSLTGISRYDGFYTLTFKAASPGQSLQVTWTQAAGAGSITLQAAALQ